MRAELPGHKESGKPENLGTYIAQDIEYGNVELITTRGGKIYIYRCTRFVFRDMRPLSARGHTALMRKWCPTDRVLCPYCAGSFARMGNLKRHVRENRCPNKRIEAGGEQWADINKFTRGSNAEYFL